MSRIEVDGEHYDVVENMGFNHSVGMYTKLVRDGERERMAVKQGKRWRFWTAADRVKPLKVWEGTECPPPQEVGRPGNEKRPTRR